MEAKRRRKIGVSEKDLLKLVAEGFDRNGSAAKMLKTKFGIDTGDPTLSVGDQANAPGLLFFDLMLLRKLPHYRFIF
jgi:hypothetical protein